MVRKWWEERCIEWCYGRFEDGKFGDQKYLDDWPERFYDAVHVLGNKELALAPWNAIRFPYGKSIFYHFHGVRIISNNTLNIGAHMYKLPRPIFEQVYKPYFVELKRCVILLGENDAPVKSQIKKSEILKKTYRRLRSIYHAIDSILNSGEVKW